MRVKSNLSRFIPLLFISLITLASVAQAELPTGIYSPFSVAPTVKQGVPQQLAARLRLESGNPNGPGWWFCGQSSTATAIDFLRSAQDTKKPPLTDQEKYDQLKWFHNQLQSQSSDYNVLNHYKSDINWLNSIMVTYKSDEFDTIIFKGQNSAYGRTLFRDSLLNALKTRVAVALIGNEGHFVTVWKIDYQPNNGGGNVYYFDGEWGYGDMVVRSFSEFLDKMPTQTSGFSAMAIKKK